MDGNVFCNPWSRWKRRCISELVYEIVQIHGCKIFIPVLTNPTALAGAELSWCKQTAAARVATAVDADGHGQECVVLQRRKRGKQTSCVQDRKRALAVHKAAKKQKR